MLRLERAQASRRGGQRTRPSGRRVRSASLLPPSALSRPLTVAAANGGRPEPPPTPPSRSWLATAATAVGSAALLAAALLAPAPALADAATFPGFRAAPTTSASLTAVRGPAAAEADLAPDELATVRLFQGATPSVVNIANLQQVSSYSSLDAQSVPVGTGSGFVWDAEGHIVTNFHVVRGASSIKVALIDASVYPATFIAGDADKDVAVLKLEAPPDVIARLTPASLGASANLLVGQKVFAIGNPCVWGWRRVERGGRRWPPLRTWPTPPAPPSQLRPRPLALPRRRLRPRPRARLARHAGRAHQGRHPVRRGGQP